MKAILAVFQLFLTFALLTITLLANADYVRARSSASIIVHEESLVSTPSRDGLGEISINVSEDDGVDVSISFPIGYPFNPPRLLKQLPYPLRISGLYQYITGLPLPENVYQALINAERKEFEISQNDGWLEELISIDKLIAQEKGDNTPRSMCGGMKMIGKMFTYDLCVKGNYYISQKADDICFMTAAFDGNHVMQLGYKTASGSASQMTRLVMKGTWVASHKKTGVNRVRYGKIFNAGSNNMSHFVLQGDAYLNIGQDALSQTGPCWDLF